MHIVNTGRAANKGGLRTNRRPVVRSPGTADIDCVTGTIRLTEWGRAPIKWIIRWENLDPDSFSPGASWDPD